MCLLDGGTGYKQLGANSENAGGFVSDSWIKDVEVTRDGERNEVSLAAPDVSNLLMIDSSPKCPCCSHFAGFNVPLTERVRLLAKTEFQCNFTEFDSTICRRGEQRLAIRIPRDSHLEGFVEHDCRIK